MAAREPAETENGLLMLAPRPVARGQNRVYSVIQIKPFGPGFLSPIRRPRFCYKYVPRKDSFLSPDSDDPELPDDPQSDENDAGRCRCF